MSEPSEKYSIDYARGIAEAVARHSERDTLDELIAFAEAEHGPISDAEIQAKRKCVAACPAATASLRDPGDERQMTRPRRAGGALFLAVAKVLG